MVSSNGKEEMDRCQEVFTQICWLAERFWPDVDGMGEEDESGRLGMGGIGGVGDSGSPADGHDNFSPLNGISEAANGGA